MIEVGFSFRVVYFDLDVDVLSLIAYVSCIDAKILSNLA